MLHHLRAPLLVHRQRMVAAPTRAQLLNLRPGRDSAVVFPPRSKPDQWGERIARSPIGSLTKPLSSTRRCLARPRARTGVQVPDRDSRPLFGDARGRRILTTAYAPLEAGSHPPLRSHGCRLYRGTPSGRDATALHAANVPDSMIMLICRWLSPESLRVIGGWGPRTRASDQRPLHERDAQLNLPTLTVAGDQETAQLRLRRRARPTSAPARPLLGTMQPGDAVVVPADLWPAYSCRELGGAGWAATIRRVHASTAASPSVSHRRATVGPTKTNSYHSTSSEWLPSSRPDFPPASPCGNREFWADVPHRNRDHRPTVRCVVYIHSFPTTSRTQEGGFSAQRDMSSCSGRLHHGGPGWGP